MKKIIINWFRNDLRISDNSSLYHASIEGYVLPIYIINNKKSSNSNNWLNYSLISLNNSLKGNLAIYEDKVENVFSKIFSKINVTKLFFNKCYEPYNIDIEKKVTSISQKNNVEIKIFNNNSLTCPSNLLKDDNKPYKVFTHFYKNLLSKKINKTIFPTPKKIQFVKTKIDNNYNKLIQKISNEKKIILNNNVGEENAQKKLKNFIEKNLKNYGTDRNFPYKNCVSYLSANLSFGEISTNQIIHNLSEKQDKEKEPFVRQLIWREFCYNLVYHFPNLDKKNLQNKFDNFPWIKNDDFLMKWQQGKTGYPIIDAGMRELKKTGYMHNRLRMIVGSFLVKNLLIHWHYGAKWFSENLFDADFANNNVSWQWVSGCGTDAAPYFRIFNPILQGKKFDPHGTYTKKYVPELNKLDIKYLFEPWKTPKEVLRSSSVILGKDYPYPIIDIEQSRKKALEIYKCYK